MTSFFQIVVNALDAKEHATLQNDEHDGYEDPRWRKRVYLGKEILSLRMRFKRMGKLTGQYKIRTKRNQ